jgi:tetratricopeptide (TPR) repeat protein
LNSIRSILKAAEDAFESGQWKLTGALAFNAIQFEPRSSEAWAILAGAQVALGRYQPGLEAADRSLSIAPSNPAARWNRFNALMGLGRLKEAWADQEWGKVIGIRPVRSLLPEWSGGQKSILVHCEQGYGDVIQHLRFLAGLRERGVRVILETYAPLVALGVENDLADTVYAVPEDRHLPFGAESQAALLSLPYLLGLDAVDGCKYLSAESDEAYLGKVGVCWKGSDKHPNDANRSLGRDDVKLLDGLADVVCFQRGESLPFGDDALRPMFQSADYAETARKLAGLKTLITVDTSMAHLAGALGVKTLLILPTTGEPRWGMGESTVWYDSVTLIRTEKIGLRGGLEKARRMVEDGTA